MKKTLNKLIVCPNCGSKEIKGAYTMSPLEASRFEIYNKMIIAPPRNIDYYGCNVCGYYGPSIEVPSSKYKVFLNQLKNQRKHIKIKRSPGGINNYPKWVRIISIIVLIVILTLFFLLFVLYF